MLKFNALANGPSGEEQKPGEKVLLSHGREDASVPSPGEPLMASGFPGSSAPPFLGDGETLPVPDGTGLVGPCSLLAGPSSIKPTSCPAAPTRAWGWRPVGDPRGSWWMLHSSSWGMPDLLGWDLVLGIPSSTVAFCHHLHLCRSLPRLMGG